MPVIAKDEAVEIEVEAVLHRGAVDLGDEPARLGQGSPVDADAIADGDELLGRPARMPPAPAADRGRAPPTAVPARASTRRSRWS
jgi:hypothetical protein